MSAGTVIIITPPTMPQLATEGVENEDTTIRIKLEGEGSVADLLRQAADVLDGQQE